MAGGRRAEGRGGRRAVAGGNEFAARPVVADTVWVQRISVVGNSGSGKTTLARSLAAAIGVPRLELDSVFHQPGWEPLDGEEFRRTVSAFASGEAWVTDGNYSAVQDIIWARADTVIWVDPPRHRVMRQLLARTLRRMATGQELWNGNREQWTNLFRLDPERSILRWAWTNHRRYRARYLLAQADPANGHLAFVRVRTPADAEELLDRAAAAAEARTNPASRAALRAPAARAAAPGPSARDGSGD